MVLPIGPLRLELGFNLNRREVKRPSSGLYHRGVFSVSFDAVLMEIRACFEV